MSCYICSQRLKKIYEKNSPNGKKYSIYSCQACGLWQIYPIPVDDIQTLYQKEYFEKRTDRGYNNYTGVAIEKSVVNTFLKNLKDLKIPVEKKGHYLEIGCAAGHTLKYMQDAGWQVLGIDISPEMTQFAQSRGLPVICGDFLKINIDQKFDIIALWATLEHLPNPKDFIEKAKSLLKPQGHFLLSTCHTGFFAKVYRENWRYLNVPEHIFYFSKKSLKNLFEKEGFFLNRCITYGSGFTQRNKASLLWKTSKMFFDKLAKFGTGDMIACDFVLKTRDELI